MPKRSTLRLTTRSIAALPATGRDTVHWDRDLAGFGVRVQRNGRKAYVVQSRGSAFVHSRSNVARTTVKYVRIRTETADCHEKPTTAVYRQPSNHQNQ